MFFCQKCGYLCMDKRFAVEILLPRLRRGKRLQRKARSRQKICAGMAWANFLAGWPKKNSPLKQGIFLFCYNVFKNADSARRRSLLHRRKSALSTIHRRSAQPKLRFHLWRLCRLPQHPWMVPGEYSNWKIQYSPLAWSRKPSR